MPMPMANHSRSRSQTSSYPTIDPILEFHEFLDTLDPEIRERYRTEHYALKDDDEHSVWSQKFTRKSKDEWDSSSVTNKLSTYGIPKEYEGTLALPYTWYKKLRCLFLISEYSFVQPGIVRGSYGVYHERFLHLVSFPSIIHPYSDFYWTWNLLICLLLTASLIYEPYLTAFRFADLSKTPNTIFSFSVSFILLVDAFLAFRVGHKDPVTTNILLDPLIIRREYLSGKFSYNMLTRIPYDSIMFAFFVTEEQRATKTELTWIRLVAFSMKVMRFEKLHWFMHELTLSFNMNTWTSQIAMHGILVLFCAHWGACLHWLLPDVVNAYHFEQHKKYKADSWITKLDLWNKPTDFQYMNAFLRSLANVLCLDGGQSIPREYEEMFATSLLLMLSLSIVSYFISTFSTMVLQFQRSDDTFIEMLGCVQEYMRFRRIPFWLRERIMAYFDGKFRGKFFPESQVFGTISANLKNQILLHNCKHMLENAYLFSDIPMHVMQNMVQRLTYEVYIPGDVILSPHIRKESIFFIEDGYFGVINEFGDCIQILKHGDFFGEVDLLLPDIPRKTSIVTLAISNVYKLSKVEYKRCMDMFPEIHEKISAVANERIAKDVKQLAQQLHRIDKAKRWKETVLQGKRTVEEYYADLDAGKVPVYHISPAALQQMHFENSKQSKLEPKGRKPASDATSRISDFNETSHYLSEVSSRNTSNV